MADKEQKKEKKRADEKDRKTQRVGKKKIKKGESARDAIKNTRKRQMKKLGL